MSVTIKNGVRMKTLPVDAFIYHIRFRDKYPIVSRGEDGLVFMELPEDDLTKIDMNPITEEPPYVVDGHDRPIGTVTNYVLWMDYNPDVFDLFGLNEFTGQITFLKSSSWGRQRGEWLQDTDISVIRRKMEGTFRQVKRDVLLDAIAVKSHENAYHPIRDYFLSLPEWDGTPRLDTLLVDYLGADDDRAGYTRTVTRKSFVSCVARVFCPGVKHDEMLILYGDQGIGKSTLLSIMGGDWFCDSLTSFGDKAAMEQLSSAWLIEIPELNTLTKRDSEDAKAFLSKTRDSFRRAYARYVSDVPRQCVFFGTTNERECLKDWKNRRFWLVDGHKVRRKKDANKDLRGERDQIWAEAYYYFKQGETLYLSQQMAEVAEEVATAHRAQHPWESDIKDYLEMPIPKDYMDKYDILARRQYITDYRTTGSAPCTAHLTIDLVCVQQVWVECLGRAKEDLQIKDSKIITQILEQNGWRSIGSRRVRLYGSQRCYKHN